VFPLRGKLLNVRDATSVQLMNNVEISALCAIIGLRFDCSYDITTEEGRAERAKLRYGKVVLMTDQDHDGSHIKGLVINFFHYFWPKLLEGDSFLQGFMTPIVKVLLLYSYCTHTVLILYPYCTHTVLTL
jgi:DNA topoisomerase-2